MLVSSFFILWNSVNHQQGYFKCPLTNEVDNWNMHLTTQVYDALLLYFYFCWPLVLP